MACNVFDREKAVLVLVDAIDCGDQTAMDRWKVSARTLYRYRSRLHADPVLAAAVKHKRDAMDGEWRSARRTFLRSAIAKLQALIENASEERIRDIAGAIKIVGDLEVVSGALGENAPKAETEAEPPVQLANVVNMR